MSDSAEGGKAILEASLPTGSTLLPEVVAGGLVELLSQTPQEAQAAQDRWDELVRNSGMTAEEAEQYIRNSLLPGGGWLSLP